MKHFWLSVATLLWLAAPVSGADTPAPVSATQLVEQARAEISEIDVAELEGLRERGAVIVDVREPEEVAQGRIPGAEAVPRGVLEFRIDGLAGVGQPVVVYCRSGARGALAAQTLQNMGYQEVYSLKGGYKAWKQAGDAD